MYTEEGEVYGEAYDFARLMGDAAEFLERLHKYEIFGELFEKGKRFDELKGLAALELKQIRSGMNSNFESVVAGLRFYEGRCSFIPGIRGKLEDGFSALKLFVECSSDKA